MKPIKSFFEFELPITVNSKKLFIQIGVTDILIGNDGIGSYEFWGAMCSDSGSNYVEAFTTVYLFAWSERRQRMVRISNRLHKLIDWSDEILEAVNGPIMNALYEHDYRQRHHALKE
jgi:hypothetical protein